MDETKLVIIWDEVIGDIIAFIFDALATNHENLLHDVVLEPISRISVESINTLYQILMTEQTYIYMGDLFEQICFFVYLCCLFYFAIIFLFTLVKLLVTKQAISLFIEMIIRPAKSFVILQCLHFIGIPLITEFLQVLPKVLYDVSHFIRSDKTIPGQKLVLADIPQEQILLQTVLLIVIFISMLYVTIQFFQLGLQIVLAFIICYIQLIRAVTLTTIFDALKYACMRVFIIFAIQQILLIESFAVATKIETLSQLVQCAAMLGFAGIIPTIIQKERGVSNV